MEEKDFYYREDGTKVYHIEYEELIGNVFSILNCTDVKVDKISRDLFDRYIKMTKRIFEQSGIEAVCYLNSAVYEKMDRNHIFAFSKRYDDSKCYDDIVMLKELTQEELQEKYQQLPEEVLDVLRDEIVIENIIDRYNDENLLTGKEIKLPKRMALHPMLPTQYSRKEREKIRIKEKEILKPSNPNKN